jgi:hypothetical protein
MDAKANRMLALVNSILEEDYGKQLVHIKPQDKLKLLTFDAWRQMHKVSIRYILQTILPHFIKIQKRIGRYRKNSMSLGVPISHLTGKKSEEMLVYWIGRNFPDRENVSMWRQKAIQRILDHRLGSDEEEEVVQEKRKTILDFKTPEKFAQSYAARIREERAAIEKVTTDNRNKLRPYRDNPFI